MIRMILAGENEHIVYGGLIEVVDAAEFEAHTRAAPGAGPARRIADLVVLNKADRVDETSRQALGEELEGSAPGHARRARGVRADRAGAALRSGTA